MPDYYYYVVLKKCQTYGPQRDTWHEVIGPDGKPEVYTESAADARCEELDSAPYTTSHNESGRPDYRPSKRRIKKAKS